MPPAFVIRLDAYMWSSTKEAQEGQRRKEEEKTKPSDVVSPFEKSAETVNSRYYASVVAPAEPRISQQTDE
jgi:hypothetical protein